MGLVVCAGGPREEEAAEERGAGGEGQAEKRGEEAIFQAGAGDKEGADCDPLESHDTEEEGSGSGEVEKHGISSVEWAPRDCMPDWDRFDS